MVIPSGLQCNTRETCPQCHVVVSDEAIRRGWRIDSNDYTTACESCHNRFVPRFCISAADGSDPTYCEYLSPNVLHKELDTLLRDTHSETSPGAYISSRTFRLRSPTIFWNLVWHITNYSLPITFLIPWMSPPVSPTNSSAMAAARSPRKPPRQTSSKGLERTKRAVSRQSASAANADRALLEGCTDTVVDLP